MQHLRQQLTNWHLRIHTQDNVDIYIKGKFFASERRILFTKWVGQAWEELSTKKDMIIWSFKKFGITVAIDRSEDSEINTTLAKLKM